MQLCLALWMVKFWKIQLQTVFEMHSLFVLFRLSSELLQHRLFSNTQFWFVLYPFLDLELYHQLHRMFQLLNLMPRLNWGLWFSCLSCLQNIKQNEIIIWNYDIKFGLLRFVLKTYILEQFWKYVLKTLHGWVRNESFQSCFWAFPSESQIMEIVTEVKNFICVLTFLSSMFPWRKLHIWEEGNNFWVT